MLDKKDLLNNLHPLQDRGGGGLFSRLIAANFRPIRMQQNSNLHTTLECEFSVFIYRGGVSLVETMGGGGLDSLVDTTGGGGGRLLSRSDQN